MDNTRKVSRAMICFIAVAAFSIAWTRCVSLGYADAKKETAASVQNVVFILVDDLGWRDLGCTGSTFYETPHIDRLRSQGMLFTDAYAAAPVCSPTRASILSGKYPARVGVTDYIDWNRQHHPLRGKLIDAPYVDHLPLEEVSLASALRNHGYQTWHLGKWHLGDAPYYPEKHGFDVNIAGNNRGMIENRNGYFSPWGLENLSDAGPPGEFLPDRLTDDAIALIRVREQQGPFFLNLSFYCVHEPVQAKPELTAKFEAKSRRLKLDQIEPFAEGEPSHTVKYRNRPIKRRMVQSDPVYAAMIASIDENIGKLMQCLDELGIADETLVIFTSDNGGVATSVTAPTSNLPLSEGKGWMYEGGLRVPLIVRFPPLISEDSTCREPVTSPDFYPTILEAAGLPPMPEQHTDGESLWSLVQGSPPPDREAIFWHFPHYANFNGTPGSAIRSGDWKLIEFFEDGRLELYNLIEDPSETRNLVAEEPERTATLHNQLKAWRQRVEARYPTKNTQAESISDNQ